MNSKIKEIFWWKYTEQELSDKLNQDSNMTVNDTKELIKAAKANPRTTPLILRSKLSGAIIKCNGDGELFMLGAVK